MRAFGYVVFWSLAAAICWFALPGIWHEAHGFWDTVLSLGIFLFVLVFVLGVALWAIDLGCALGNRLNRFIGRNRG